MSGIIANITTETITTTTTYENKTSLSVLNSHATDGVRVQQSTDGTYIVLASGQSVTLNAPTGSTLPDMTIKTDDANMEAQIVAL